MLRQRKPRPHDCGPRLEQLQGDELSQGHLQVEELFVRATCP